LEFSEIPTNSNGLKEKEWVIKARNSQ